MRFYEGGNTRARKQDLGHRPNLLAFWKKQEQKLLYKLHIYAVLRGREYKGKKARPTIKGQGAMAKKCHLSEGQLCVAKC
ncbi:MAG: hypothetical protein EOM28_06460 [Clostridia bacterium]|nr:hypothetical protein [Clostridia bacterium]